MDNKDFIIYSLPQREPSAGNAKSEFCMIERATFTSGHPDKLIYGDDRIIFIRRGVLECALEGFSTQELSAGQAFVLPGGYYLSLEAGRDCSLLMISLREWPSSFPLHSLTGNKGRETEEADMYLHTNRVLEEYLHSLETYLDYGLNLESVMPVKLVELFYIFLRFYPKEQLYGFFHLCLTDERAFRQQVRIHYRKVRNIRQLAEMMNYSYSGFNKRFRRIFGVSAYSWMQEQKAGLIYRELSLGRKSLKEISSDYSFLSLSHFNEFCHKELGASPSVIRRRNTIGIKC